MPRPHVDRQWMSRWADLARFDVVEVVSSADAGKQVLERSRPP